MIVHTVTAVDRRCDLYTFYLTMYLVPCCIVHFESYSSVRMEMAIKSKKRIQHAGTMTIKNAFRLF